MILGVAEGETYLASDVPAILNDTRDVYYIGNQQAARLSPGEIHFYDLNGDEVELPLTEITWDAQAAEKGGYQHFKGVRGLALSVRLAPPLFDLPALPLHLGRSQGRAPLGGAAHIDGGGLGGLLHLLHGPGAAVGAGGAGGGGAGGIGETAAGYLGGGVAPAPLPLGQLLFQLGRHDAAGAGLGGLTTLFLAFDQIGRASCRERV